MKQNIYWTIFKFIFLLFIISIFTLYISPENSIIYANTCKNKSIGDADCNDIIDIEDYNIWRNEYIRDILTFNADFSGNGSVSLVDFAIWRATYYSLVEKYQQAENSPTPIFPSPTVSLSPTPTIEISSNPFGVMLSSGNLNQTQRLELAQTLGVKYYRPKDIDVEDIANVNCVDCNIFSQAGIKLLLTVRNGGGGGQPSNPPADLDLYKNNIATVLDRHQPELLVVENEENSQQLFYSGTPSQYHQELAAACSIAHQKGYKCTNGGLVSALVALLVGNNYFENGEYEKADDFLQKSLDPDMYALWQQDPDSPILQQQITRGKELLSGYKQSGADFVNFHWYIADTQSLAEAVDYLKNTTGLEVITNEVGQQGNEDPLQVQNVMQEINQLKLPIAAWFSIDIEAYGGARALNNSDGSLRSNGVSFQDFISNTY